MWGLEVPNISQCNVFFSLLKAVERDSSDVSGQSSVGSLIIFKSPPIKIRSPANFDKNTFRDDENTACPQLGALMLTRVHILIL